MNQRLRRAGPGNDLADRLAGRVQRQLAGRDVHQVAAGRDQDGQDQPGEDGQGGAARAIGVTTCFR